MRKFLFPLFYNSVSLILVLVLAFILPKYAGMLLFFFIFLVLAGYLWIPTWEGVQRLGKFWRLTIVSLYWVPYVTLMGGVITGLVYPFLEWHVALRTYLLSLLLAMFAGLIFPMAMILLADLYRLFLVALRYFFPGARIGQRPIRRPLVLLRIGWFTGCAAFLVMIAGTLFWQYDFRVREVPVSIEGLPASFEGFRIIQFSDVHLGSWADRAQLARAVEMINRQRPDVILFTGDMFNYRTADGNGFETILAKLKAPCGIFAIKGNHDYGDYIPWKSRDIKQENMQALHDFYRALGWKLLENSHDFIVRGTDSLAIIGVENWGASHRFQRLGNIDQARKGVKSMQVQILMSHDPSHWDSIVSKHYSDIDLTLAGHTHGGQIGMECCGIRFSLVQGISPHWGGLYRNPATKSLQHLYVNRGLGTIGYAGRIGILPEITLIELRRTDINRVID